MAHGANRLSAIAWAYALTCLLVIAMMIAGCSTHNDSLSNLRSAQDYTAQREPDGYAYGYGPYPLCPVYDPFCFGAAWPSAPIYYFSGDDGDNDCDDGNCVPGRHHKRLVTPRAGFNGTAPSKVAAGPHGWLRPQPEFSGHVMTPGFGRAAVGGRGQR
jgi:hypothetical protein